jgi:hypothetical protein
MTYLDAPLSTLIHVYLKLIKIETNLNSILIYFNTQRLVYFKVFFGEGVHRCLFFVLFFNAIFKIRQMVNV